MGRLEDLIKKLYEIGVIKFGEFTLKSGKKSPYYIDLRILPSYPSVLREVGRVMSKMIENSPEKPTRLCGVPMAGLAIANVIGVEKDIPIIYTRKEPIIYKDIAHQLRRIAMKEEYRNQEIVGLQKAINIIEELSGFKTHGIIRYVDGEIQEGDKIGIVDDIITTAKSKLEVVDLIKLETKRRRINAEICGIYVFLDREQGGKQTLEKKGFPLYSVVKISDVMELIYHEGLIKKSTYEKVMNYILKERG